MSKKMMSSLFLFLSVLSACASSTSPNCSMSYFDLFGQFSSHQDRAFTNFIKCRNQYDGGNLEDLYRAAGMYLNINPENFFYELESHDVSNNELRDFLLILPLSTVDRLDLKIAEVQRRIESVKSAKETVLQESALMILEEELRFLLSVNLSD